MARRGSSRRPEGMGMNLQGSHFDSLASRDGFNASVRHIKKTIAIVEEFEGKKNLADIVNEMLEAKELEREEIQSIVSMVLKDKYGYVIVSANLRSAIAVPSEIVDQVSKWNGVDLVALYSHPDIGIVAVNPKNPSHVGALNRLNKSELVVVYAGNFAKPAKADVASKAAEALVSIFEGKKVKPSATWLKGDCVYKYVPPKPDKAPKAEKSAGKAPKKPAASATKSLRGVKASASARYAAQAAPAEEQNPVKVQRQADMAAVRPNARMTPMYSVVVANELFHNGNVEAWKRIIESYNAKYPNLQVLVYYDNERITNLNALFKWGKVKHGSAIQFAVAGEEIKDVAKLQRYLSQGASPMFEAFLRGPVNAILPLF
jgi:hypothetical protein